jgi:hypothetical protein
LSNFAISRVNRRAHHDLIVIVTIRGVIMAAHRPLLRSLSCALLVAGATMMFAQPAHALLPLDIDPVQVGFGHDRAYVKGTDGRVWWRQNGIPGWHSINGLVGSGPAVIDQAPGPDPYDLDTRLFARGIDASLVMSGQVDATNLAWTSLGGVLTSAPAADWSSRFDTWVAVRGTDGAIYVRDNTLGPWSPWTTLGGIATSAPSITINDDIGVFVAVRGTDGRIWQRRADVGDGWHLLLSGGTTINSRPDIDYTETPTGWQLTTSWRANDNTLWINDTTGSHQVDATELTSAPTNYEYWNGAIAREVYVRGTDLAVWRYVSDTGTWERLGGHAT